MGQALCLQDIADARWVKGCDDLRGPLLEKNSSRIIQWREVGIQRNNGPSRVTQFIAMPLQIKYVGSQRGTILDCNTTFSNISSYMARNTSSQMIIQNFKPTLQIKWLESPIHWALCVVQVYVLLCKIGLNKIWVKNLSDRSIVVMMSLCSRISIITVIVTKRKDSKNYIVRKSKL